jgi:lia operon protein LiaG
MLGKTTFQRIIIVTAIVTAAALLIAGLAFMATGFSPLRGEVRRGLPVDEHAALALAGAASLSVDAVSEDVQVSDADGDAVEAWLHGSVGEGSPEAAPRLTARMEGSTAMVKVEHPALQTGPFWSNLVLEVRVPRKYAGDLRVHTVSGELKLGDRAWAAVALGTTSGGITLGAVRAAGPFQADTTSGEVTAGSIQAGGAARLHTTSGEITLKGLQASRADITTVSGDVTVSAMRGEAAVSTTSGEITLAFDAQPPTIDAHSTSGDVKITLPADASFSLDAGSSSGDVRCDFPITVQGSGGEHHVLKGTVGAAPSAAVRVSTTSGEIRIKR